MQDKLSRRDMIKTGAIGAAATGLFLTRPEESHADLKKKTGNPPFLKQWSPATDWKKDLKPGNTPIRLACWSSTTTLDYPKDMSIEEMVKRIRDAGYTSGNSHPGRFNKNPWLDAPESEIKELKDALKKYDVTFFDVHANANNIHPDLAERKKEIQWTTWELETAERVGAPLVSGHIGSCAPSAVAPHPNNWTWDTWKLGVKVLKQIIKDTEGMKAVLALEPDPNVQINCNTACKQIMEECGPRIKICYDPCNMSSSDMIYRTGEFLEESFEMLGEDIYCAHAKDVTWTSDLQPCIKQCFNGTGHLDYETYLIQLSRMKYPRTLLIEHLSNDQYPAARKFVVDTAERLGVKIYT